MLSPILTLALATLIILLYGAFTNSARGSAWLTALALAVAAGQLSVAPLTGPAFPTAHGVLVEFSTFTNLASFLILLTALVVLPVMHFMNPAPYGKPEAPLLLLITTLGMLILVTAADFLTFYVALELMSFPLYILCAFHRHDAKSSESALKYFILGGFASGLTLFGISLLFAALGTTSFHGLATTLSSYHPAALSSSFPPILIVGLSLTLLGSLFKLSVVPFHMWTPDVYEGAPTPVAAILASLPKIAVFVFLMRVTMGPFQAMAEIWQPALAVLATLSMFAGAALAIVQNNLKRLLAYSAIAHVGFMLVGVVAGNVTGHGGVLFYAFIYALTMIALFATLITSGAQTVDDLKGLATRNMPLAVLLLIMFFSLAGIPPMAGFMAKFSVFLPAVEAGYTWLAVAAVLASVVACYYPLWLIKIMFFDTAIAHPSQPKPEEANSFALNFVISAAGVGILVLGVFPSLVADATLAAAQHLY